MKYDINRINNMKPEFLSKAKKSGYICPKSDCKNGSGSDGDGIQPVGDGIHYKCFKCGLYASTFDLYALYSGIDMSDTTAVLESAYNYFNLQPEEYDAPKQNRADQKKEEPEKKEAPVDYTEFYKKAAKNNNFEYLESRGISKETQQRFLIGYVDAWKHPNAPASVPTSPRCIIPRSRKSYLARDTRPGVTEYAKQNCGSTDLFNIKALNKPDSVLFIVEGEIDALSVIEAGENAIGLCSTSQAKKFTDTLIKAYKGQAVALMLDNDDAGRKAAAEIAETLKNNNIPCVSAEYQGKDPNSALNADKEAFRGIVKATAQKAQEARQNALQQGEYNAAELLDYFRTIESRPAGYEAKTGFKELDKNLSGGLHEGLIIIGAISGFGKTTFCLQVADQIAAGGQDVLFFSLEMSKYEIMAKSISRYTFLRYANEKTPEGRYIARDTQQILNNRRYAAYTAQERQAISEAIEDYAQAAKHLYIYEGRYKGERLTVKAIREITEEHIKKTGNKPAIFLDYLQILAPTDPRQTDKQSTDTAVTELKEISRALHIPVFAISSFNRLNYAEPVSMTSFKESGAIEYSSDILFGLQYAGMDYIPEDAREKEAARKKRMRELFEEVKKKKKSREPIEIELKCLKHRTGYTFDLTFQAIPAYNYFADGFVPVEDKDNPFTNMKKM